MVYIFVFYICINNKYLIETIYQISSSTVFSPPLSSRKSNMIENWGFGTIGKIILSFDDQWWADCMDGFAFFYDEPSNNTETEAAEDWTRGIAFATTVVNK